MHDSAADSAASDTEPPELSAQEAKDRSGVFFVVSIGLLALFIAYFMSIRFVEMALDREIESRVEHAIVVTHFNRPVIRQIKERIDEAVRQSRWIRFGGLRVSTLVLARDGVTWLYVDGHGTPPTPEGLAPTDMIGEWLNYLPATAEVTVTLPHTAPISNAILFAFTAVFLRFAYIANQRQSGQASQRLREALEIRDRAADRTREIESELAMTRLRLSQIEPMEREHSEEIDSLQQEREGLQRKLSALAAREEALRGRADSAIELAQDVRALEDLLEEASGDLETKDGEIGQLEQSLKKASKASDRAANTKARTSELIARRFRTLYKTIEIDDRAIDDISSLGDESLRLKAEESVKRLAEEADNVAVRRKVGGLPGYVQVFELGFAGKGRIYYTRGKSKRFRILLVGAKNTQPTDLEYLSRLPRSEFS
jgi:DNA repair exonuclease SbcCD ATPase subunit